MLIYQARPSAPGSAAARPAVEALLALQSVTRAGTTYQAYSGRVGDTKIVVDRYLREAPAGPLRDAIEVTMNYYVIAGQAWSLQIRDQRAPVSTLADSLGTLDPRTTACAIVQLMHTDNNTRSSAVGALQVPEFWGCATRQLEDAERLLAAAA